MQRFINGSRLLVLVILAVLANDRPAVRADEGMWLPNFPPRELLKQKYGFQPSDVWLVHLERSAVRFNSGGSGSFISADGLVLTNQHVGAGAVQKMSTSEHDYVRTGFLARTRQEELKCHDLELNVLMSIEDVTGEVDAVVKPGMTSEAASQARRAVMNQIEQRSVDKTGLRSDVVTLYHGGLYHLYRYRRYTDVRLVFVPEQDIAFFGGDPDNFEYPRYDLDMCLFRVYEDGKPARIEHYLRWSPSGVSDGELVIVAGHPGSTSRLDTVANLAFVRDRLLPSQLDEIRRREITLTAYSQQSVENGRRAQRALFGCANSRKVLLRMLAGLQDPEIFQKKVQEEATLRKQVAANPKLAKADGQAWDEVAAAIKQWATMYREYHLWEDSAALDTSLFSYARSLVRLADESPRPNADRLREYRQSNLPSLKQALFSTAPVYKDLETARLADSLSLLVETLGADQPLVEKVLAGKSPQQRAELLVAGTRLDDVQYRHQLADGGRLAIEKSEDPMVRLARLIDPRARDVRKEFETRVDEPLRVAYARIANARFALADGTIYPDATFTLRFSFGTVRGYRQDAEQLAGWTTIGGAYEHQAKHQSQPPFRLPESWIEHKGSLDLKTPLNFVSTCDIIGGNSGSPVVNRRGELVGLIFDGNRYSPVWRFIFDDQQGRAIAVDSRAITEALRKIYGATELVRELNR